MAELDTEERNDLRTNQFAYVDREACSLLDLPINLGF